MKKRGQAVNKGIGLGVRPSRSTEKHNDLHEATEQRGLGDIPVSYVFISSRCSIVVSFNRRTLGHQNHSMLGL
jgi:hypothetical protein